MFKMNRLGIVLALAALAALEIDLHSASAQRRRGTYSGSSNSSSNTGNNQANNQQNNSSNNDNSSDNDDDKKKKDSGQTNSNSNSNQSGQSNSNSSGGSTTGNTNKTNSNSSNYSSIPSQGNSTNKNSGQTNSNNSGNSGNSNSSGNSNKNSQGVQIQQLIQGQGTTSTTGQTYRGSRSGSNQGQGQSQNQLKIQGQSNSQQVQNFQPWQMWQGQGQGNNRGNQQNNQKKNSNWFIQIGGGPEPFSGGWYDKHPQAWHWKHDNNDAWKIATAAGVIGWLGWGQPYYQTQVIYEPVPVIVFDPEAQGPWMPLGVYSLLTGPADTGTRILQLSINPQGFIRGSYYDMITDDTYNLRGRADQSTQYVQWSLDTNQSLMFYTPLYQLTQSQGVINVRLPGGTQQWQVVRMEYAQ